MRARPLRPLLSRPRVRRIARSAGVTAVPRERFDGNEAWGGLLDEALRAYPPFVSAAPGPDGAYDPFEVEDERAYRRDTARIGAARERLARDLIACAPGERREPAAARLADWFTDAGSGVDFAGRVARHVDALDLRHPNVGRTVSYVCEDGVAHHFWRMPGRWRAGRAQCGTKLKNPIVCFSWDGGLGGETACRECFPRPHADVYRGELPDVHELADQARQVARSWLHERLALARVLPASFLECLFGPEEDESAWGRLTELAEDVADVAVVVAALRWLHVAGDTALVPGLGERTVNELRSLLPDDVRRVLDLVSEKDALLAATAREPDRPSVYFPAEVAPVTRIVEEVARARLQPPGFAPWCNTAAARVTIGELVAGKRRVLGGDVQRVDRRDALELIDAAHGIRR